MAPKAAASPLTSSSSESGCLSFTTQLSGGLLHMASARQCSCPRSSKCSAVQAAANSMSPSATTMTVATAWMLNKQRLHQACWGLYSNCIVSLLSDTQHPMQEQMLLYTCTQHRNKPLNNRGWTFLPNGAGLTLHTLLHHTHGRHVDLQSWTQPFRLLQHAQQRIKNTERYSSRYRSGRCAWLGSARFTSQLASSQFSLRPLVVKAQHHCSNTAINPVSAYNPDLGTDDLPVLSARHGLLLVHCPAEEVFLPQLALEALQVCLQLPDGIHLLGQHSLQGVNVLVNGAAGLVNLLKHGHLPANTQVKGA